MSQHFFVRKNKQQRFPNSTSSYQTTQTCISQCYFVPEKRKLLRTRKKRNMSKISSYSRLQEKMQYYSVLQGNQTFKVTLCLKPGGHTFEIWLNLLCLRCVWALTLVAILCKLPHIERMSCHATSNWCRALSTTTTPSNELWFHVDCQSSKLLSCHVDDTDF